MDKPKCYLCGIKHRDYFTTHQLFNGRWIPVCPACKIYYQEIEKEAKLKGGLISSNSQNGGLHDITGGDKMTKVEKKSEGANFLNREFVEQRGITLLKIESAGEEIEFTNKDKKTGQEKIVKKWQVQVSYDEQKNDDPTVWTMNNTSFNACYELFGDETDKWVGKVLEITIGGEGEMKHIKVDIVRSKKNIK